MLVDQEGDEEAHIAPRRPFNTFAPRRPNALHCYGVDFLSNKDVLELFADFAPKEVEWLDDSSCNIIFGEDGAPAKAIEALSMGSSLLEEPWVRSKPLTLKGSKHSKGPKAKPQKAPLRELFLQLRPATEADRKDPGHNGNVDSVYYAHVKEQQALQKQAAELRRAKKRQRAAERVASAANSPTGSANGGKGGGGSRPATPGPGKGKGRGRGGRAHTPGTPRGGGGRPGSRPPRTPRGGKAAGRGEEGGGGGEPAAPAPAAAAAAAPADAAAGAPAAAPASTARLGCRGLLDPLLFLRAAPAAASADAAAGSAAEGAAAGGGEDLKAALRRAEAEYASVLPAGPGAAAAAGAPAAAAPGAGAPEADRGRPARGRQALGRGRGRDGTPGRGGAHHRRRTPGRPSSQQPPEARGKKRRPVEQEPRPVAEAAAPQREVKALPEVEDFLAKHHVRCHRFQLKHTFRSIMYGQQKKPKPAPFGGKPPTKPADSQQDTPAPGADAPKTPLPGKVDPGKEAPQKESEPPPWEQYLKVNKHCTSRGQFVHTVAWEADGRRILTVVPHPTRVDLSVLARAIQKPESAVKFRKLKDIAQETGFPVFVCPPFGHPKDAQGRDPLLLVDSMLTELKKPVIFDCGSVAIGLSVSELLRSTGAACVEGLGKAPRPGQPPEAAPAASPRPTPEPAPEPALLGEGSPDDAMAA